ncbi:MAG: hypothetical protein NZM28_02890, partial [Fimbriimonadales bacterium]|nr:hypothetical protein [Fimbriimonadales bacterium]
APLLGNFAGHAICLSLFMGLAFTFALGLEFLGAAHLGLVDSLSPQSRRWVGAATALLLGMAILGLILLGQSRSVLAESMLMFSSNPSGISTPAAPSSAGDSEQAALTLSATMLLVPIFIELSAALALWGMFQHTALLFLIVMRLLSFALALLNLVPTILSVMGKGIRDVLLLVVDFIGSLRQDSASEVVPNQTPNNDSPLEESFTLPAQPHQEPTPETAVHEPPLMPETTPIDQPNLNPLGAVAPNHSEAGGTQR